LFSAHLYCLVVTMKITSILVTFVATLALPGATAQICGGAGVISVEGSTTVEPITTELSLQYTKKCPKTTFTISSLGSSAGAKAVCAVSGTTPTDIGNMSRNWKDTEASQQSDGTYKCAGEGGRSVIQVPVAVDGVTVVIEKLGNLAACFAALNNNLKTSELRWLFSSAPKDVDVSNPDSSPTVHKWKELNAACPDTVVQLKIPGTTYGTHGFFVEVVLASEGVTMRLDSNTVQLADNSGPLLNAILNNDNTIGFMGFNFASTNEALQAISIDGKEPDKKNLYAETYKPLGRYIFSNYWNDPAALLKGKCFNDFHFSKVGAAYIVGRELLPIAETAWPTNKKFIPGTCTCPRCGFWARLFGRCKKCP
jgi:ABC-type phosphate transport system substrate-binding protein